MIQTDKNKSEAKSLDPEIIMSCSTGLEPGQFVWDLSRWAAHSFLCFSTGTRLESTNDKSWAFSLHLAFDLVAYLNEHVAFDRSSWSLKSVWNRLF